MTDAATEGEGQPVMDPPAKEAQQYDEKYVTKLKNDVIAWKTRAGENKDAIKNAEAAEARLKETELKSAQALQEVAALKGMAEKRLISAEVRTIAADMGLKKMEYTKLADLATVKVLESGDVEGVREALAKLKESDPELFRLPSTTNKNFTSSQSGDNIPKKKISSGLEGLSESDYKKKEREFLKQHRR